MGAGRGEILASLNPGHILHCGRTPLFLPPNHPGRIPSVWVLVAWAAGGELLAGVAGDVPRGEPVGSRADSAAQHRNALGDKHRKLLARDLSHEDIDKVPGDDLFEIGVTDRSGSDAHRCRR